VLLKPRYAAYIVAAWLGGIVINLFSYPGWYDIAVRDLGLVGRRSCSAGSPPSTTRRCVYAGGKRESARAPGHTGARFPKRRRKRLDAAESVAVERGRGDETRDATRRTRLANERTYLAWWRTGLTTFAVSLAAGKLVPELSSGAAWPFEVIGVAFGAVGLVFIIYAYVRQKRVEEALSRGHYAPFETRVALVFAALGVLLGIGTITVILARPG
jgi:putative membrane protein